MLSSDRLSGSKLPVRALEARKTPGAAGFHSRRSSLPAAAARACLGRKRAGLDQELAVKCRSRTRTGTPLTTTFQLGLRSCWWTMTRCASGSSVRCSSAANTKVKACNLKHSYLQAEPALPLSHPFLTTLLSAVTTCANGKDAINILRDRQSHCDLVLSDVYMPGAALSCRKHLDQTYHELLWL